MKLIIGIVLAGIVVFLYLRSRQQPQKVAPRRPAIASHKAKRTAEFHAVTISCTKHACEAALALGNKRMLSNEAPLLPLPDCDASECNCRFIHHDDRRRSEDRRDPYRAGHSVDGTGQFEKERRRRRERRDSEIDSYY